MNAKPQAKKYKSYHLKSLSYSRKQFLAPSKNPFSTHLITIIRKTICYKVITKPCCFKCCICLPQSKYNQKHKKYLTWSHQDSNIVTDLDDKLRKWTALMDACNLCSTPSMHRSISRKQQLKINFLFWQFLSKNFRQSNDSWC